MSFIEQFIMALGFSADAFAVSMCKGLATKKLTWKHMALAGLWFGGFQALMPLIGYFLGTTFERYITAYDHWIAFVLLGFLGGKMIWEALKKDEEEEECASFAPREMFLMAIATSIDALAGGVAYAMVFKPGEMGWPAALVGIFTAVSLIGVITFLLSALGVKLGNIFGKKFKSKAELAGGIILVLMGTKILLEHLGFLPF